MTAQAAKSEIRKLFDGTIPTWGSVYERLYEIGGELPPKWDPSFFDHPIHVAVHEAAKQICIHRMTALLPMIIAFSMHWCETDGEGILRLAVQRGWVWGVKTAIAAGCARVGCESEMGKCLSTKYIKADEDTRDHADCVQLMMEYEAQFKWKQPTACCCR